MSIHVALNHVTHYRYDRLVALGPQIVRLRPAPHCRTRILSYSLRVLLERAIARGVFLAPGEAFGDGFESSARLCYSAVPRDALGEGIAALRRAIEDVA